MLSSAFVLVALCLVGVTLGDCPPGFQEFRSSCYGLVKEPLDWADGQSACTALNGYLAEIFSEEENVFVKKMATDNNVKAYWLGGQDLAAEGTWSWARSSSLISNHYADWYQNQPDNEHKKAPVENCLEVNADYNWQWNDVECVRKKASICKLCL